MASAKWKVSVKFYYVKGKDEKESKANAETYYKLFKTRMLDKTSGIRFISEKDFHDQSLSMTHICDKPMDVIEYFYNFNVTDGSLDMAEVCIQRVNDTYVKSARYPWGPKKVEHGSDVIKLNKEDNDHE